jgi:hypothetical protein
MRTSQAAKALAVNLTLIWMIASQAFAEDRPTASASPCDPALGAPFVYLKKLVVHDFVVQDREMAANLAGLGRDMAQWVQGGLATARRFRLGTDPGYSFAIGDPQAVRDAAQRNDAQLLVVGEFETLTLSYPAGKLSFTERFSLAPGSRWQVGVRLYVLEGESGQILSEHYYSDAMGRLGGGLPKTRPYQQAGLLGQVLQNLYPQWLADIQQDTACIPLTARVLEVQGEMAVIDVGSDALLRPGDFMRGFYDRRLAWGEWQAAFHDSVVVRQVQANTALISWEDPARATAFYPGMRIRAW